MKRKFTPGFRGTNIFDSDEMMSKAFPPKSVPVSKPYKSWEDYNRSELDLAVKNTYEADINPEAVPDLLDVVKKFLEVTTTRWRSLSATSYEKNIMSSAKAAIEKSKIK